jgi:hypothetical protein
MEVSTDRRPAQNPKPHLADMDAIIQLEKDIARYEADAAFYEARARQCRSEAALLREELENERTGRQPALEVARKLAETILRLQGLTGAEVGAAERTFSDDPADIERLRQIAANHSILSAELL